jgi:long-chain acyl-CoA synthetase
VFCGGTVIVLRRWDPEHLLHLAAAEHAQAIFLVPTHAQTLRALGEDVLRTASLPALDTLYFNAAALPVPLKEWVIDSLPDVGVHELYGSTEAGVVTNLRPDDARRKAGTVGQPWFMNELRVVGGDGAPPPPGVPGELYSRSPFLMNGYLDDDAATAACTTADGFITAGDLATVDDEGFVAIVGRSKDMIVTGGVNVYPSEIEAVLARHPAVAEAAVVGVPDATWGERITAFLVVAGPEIPDTAELERHLSTQLARYKHPREWRVIDALPRNVAGKILKQDLRAAAAGAPAP